MKRSVILGALSSLLISNAFAVTEKIDNKPPVTMPLAIKVVDEVLKLPKPRNSWESWVFNTAKMTALRCLGPKRAEELSGREGYEVISGWKFSSGVFTFEKDIEDVCTSIVKNGIYPMCERQGKFVSDSVTRKGLLSKVNFDYINLTHMNDSLSSRQGVRCAVAKDVPKEQFYSGRTSFRWIQKPLKEVDNPTMTGEITFNDVIEGDGTPLKFPMRVIIVNDGVDK